MPVDLSYKFCIVGAGSSGLAAAKNFLAVGIPFDCLEREDDVGGNWYYGKPASSVYASTHLISSKQLTEYPDFPMPDQWPEYPSHEQALEYLRSYARHFGLYDHIQFNAAVEWLAPRGVSYVESSGSLPLVRRAGEGGCGGNGVASLASNELPSGGVLPPSLTPPHQGEGDGGCRGGWLVRLTSGEERLYRGVVIANGHNWDPRWPEYVDDLPQQFAGQWLHSRQYKTPDVLRGKRVLVVGGGNSGCDLACEAAVHARSALLSTRRAYHVLPKFFRGKPIDQCHEFLLWLRAPLWARRAANAVVAHLTLGPSFRTGVPRPDHRLFETHPIINSQLHHHVGHGRLGLRPDVASFAGQRVRFVDGREDEIDLVIFATGFRLSIPFIDRTQLNWQGNAPRLYLNVFHPERDDLFCIGLIQPDSGQWGLVDHQARLVAGYLRAMRDEPRRAARFRRLKQTKAADLSGGVRHIRSPRHALEVEHYSYRNRLQRAIRQLA